MTFGRNYVSLQRNFQSKLPGQNTGEHHETVYETVAKKKHYPLKGDVKTGVVEQSEDCK